MDAIAAMAHHFHFGFEEMMRMDVSLFMDLAKKIPTQTAEA
jgi:hypothetical protein